MFQADIIDLSQAKLLATMMTGAHSRRFPMLVLSRLPGERIRVGTNITFTVLAVQGKRVRIGVTAPSHIRVLREELYASMPERPLGEEDESEKTYSCT
jgi:carbon storage regulator